MTADASRGDRVQFSIRALLVLTFLAALVSVVGRWAIDHLEQPASVLTAITLGIGLGVATPILRRELPRTPLLGGVWLLLVVVSGFWFPSSLAWYVAGFALGILGCWQSARLVRVLVALFDLSLSQPERRGCAVRDDETPLG